MDDEVWCPSCDVCAWCSDSECDGIGCIATLDPNDENDQEAINDLHDLLRAGRVFLGANQVLKRAENR